MFHIPVKLATKTKGMEKNLTKELFLGTDGIIIF